MCSWRPRRKRQLLSSATPTPRRSRRANRAAAPLPLAQHPTWAIFPPSPAPQPSCPQEQTSSLAPAIGLLVFGSGGGVVSGPYEELGPKQVGASQFEIGTQEVSAEVALPAAGAYTLLASTFAPGQEAAFVVALYSTDASITVKQLNGALVSAGSVMKGSALWFSSQVGGSVSTGGVDLGDRARPQGIAGPGAGTRSAIEPPAAKHDISKTREELGDDGKLGHAQRMELEEAQRLHKWKENVPMMTIEGQPLSDNVKKKHKELVAFAEANAAANGGLFVDPDFPKAPGSAAGEDQPAVYNQGKPVAGMPVVTQWRRPREWTDTPKLFKNDWEVENVIQGPGIDNRWLLSAINIVSGDRNHPAAAI